MAKRMTQPGTSKSSKGRQTTLFQTWGYEGNVSLNTSVKSHSGKDENELNNSAELGNKRDTHDLYETGQG